MPYCSNCGNPVTEEQDVCLACGKKLTDSEKKTASTIVNDTGGLGWGILGFCIPIVGLILFIVWKEDQPNNAKAAGKGALISVIFSVIMYTMMLLIGLGTA